MFMVVMIMVQSNFCAHMLVENAIVRWGSAWCTSSPNGYVGKARIKDDPRFITAPYRETKAFEKPYNQRTSVERTFGDLKDNYNLDNIRAAKMARAKVFMDLSCIALIASRLLDAASKEKSKAA